MIVTGCGGSMWRGAGGSLGPGGLGGGPDAAGLAWRGDATGRGSATAPAPQPRRLAQALEGTVLDPVAARKLARDAAYRGSPDGVALQAMTAAPGR